MGAYEPLHSGKVRDLYETPTACCSWSRATASPRTTTCCRPPIPDKGAHPDPAVAVVVRAARRLVPNHVVSTDVPAEFAGRAILCRRLEMVPVECVARGYLAGSGLAEYIASGAVCGVPLPAGLVDGSRAAGADLHAGDEGGDRRARRERLVRRGRGDRGRRRAAELRRLTLAVYARGAADRRASAASSWPTPSWSSAGGPTATLVLADEVLTPDSSRFWPADGLAPGRPQPSYDKQFVRDWLTSPASGLGPRLRRSRRRRCRTRSSSGPGRGTSRRTSG